MRSCIFNCGGPVADDMIIYSSGIVGEESVADKDHDHKKGSLVFMTNVGKGKCWHFKKFSWHDMRTFSNIDTANAINVLRTIWLVSFVFALNDKYVSKWIGIVPEHLNGSMHVFFITC